MDLLNQFNGSFRLFDGDDTLSSGHLAVYTALIRIWNRNRNKLTFPINRDQMIKMSKIGNLKTYGKYLQHLHDRGYIVYQKGSLPQPAIITLRYFGDLIRNSFKSGPADLEMKACGAIIATDPVAKSKPISNENATDTVAKSLSYKKKELKDSKSTNDKFLEINNDKKSNSAAANADLLPPSLNQVVQEFQSRGYPADEAIKFYEYNQAQKWRNKAGNSINWIECVDRWIKRIAGTSLTDNGDPKNTIQSLYEKFKSGQDILKQLKAEYSGILGLGITQPMIDLAFKLRQYSLQGTNDASELRVLQAYCDGGSHSKEIIANDYHNIQRIACKIAVLEHFKSHALVGTVHIFPSSMLP